MNAHSFDFSSGALSEADDRAEADRWALTRMVAAVISDAVLEEEADIIRALYAARLSAKDFMPVLDEAIALAREARGR